MTSGDQTIAELIEAARASLKPLDDVIEAARRAVAQFEVGQWTLTIPGERP